MIPLLEQHRSEIEALCRKYRVTRLEVFGSAVNGKFDPGRSDVDFLYEIDVSAPDLSDRFFQFQGEAEALLGRKVDLVHYGNIENRFFRMQIDEERTVFYGSEVLKTS